MTIENHENKENKIADNSLEKEALSSIDEKTANEKLWPVLDKIKSTAGFIALETAAQDSVKKSLSQEEGIPIEYSGMMDMADRNPAQFMGLLHNYLQHRDIDGNYDKLITKKTNEAYLKAPQSFIANLKRIIDTANELKRLKEFDFVKAFEYCFNSKQDGASVKNSFSIYAKDLFDKNGDSLIKGLDLSKYLNESIESDPGAFFVSCRGYLDKEENIIPMNGFNFLEKLKEKIDNNPKEFIGCAKYFIDARQSYLCPIKGINLSQELSRAAEKDPTTFMIYCSGFRGIMKDSDLLSELKIARAKDPATFIEWAPGFREIKGFDIVVEDEVSIALEKEPNVFLEKADNFKGIIEDSKLEELIKKAQKLSKKGKR